MFFGHGMPFPPPQQRPVNNTAHYEALGLARSATEIEIKKAYRKLVMIHHPGPSQRMHT